MVQFKIHRPIRCPVHGKLGKKQGRMELTSHETTVSRVLCEPIPRLIKQEYSVFEELR